MTANAAARTAMTTIAIYDMDKTVTRRATLTPFLLFAARRLHPWRLALLPVAGLASLLYVARIIDRGRLKEFNYGLLVGAQTPDRLQPMIEAFADRQMATNILAGARARIAQEQAAGHRLVLATASYRLYAEAIGRRLGFDDVIGTVQVLDHAGRVTAQISGDNCYGAGKRGMILEWLGQHRLMREDLHVRFYSDHVSDAVVHRWADEPFATNPHRKLRVVAKAEGWEVLDWR